MQRALAEELHSKILDIFEKNKENKNLKVFVEHLTDVKLEETDSLSSGYVNYLVRVVVPGGHTLVAKYSPPYYKIMGAGCPLSPERSRLEYLCLTTFDQLCPGCVPKAYCHSRVYNIVLMEDLCGYNNLRSELVAGNIDHVGIEQLAIRLAVVHSATHKFNMTPQKFEELCDKFRKCDSQLEDFANNFTHYPYLNEGCDFVSSQLRELVYPVFNESHLSNVIDDLVQAYIYNKECLTHANTRSRDVMIKDGDAKLIDLEYGHIGPCSVDIGMLLAHIAMIHYYHTANDNKQASQETRLAGSNMVKTYLQRMSWKIRDEEEERQKLLLGISATCGLEMFRGICSGEHKDLGVSQLTIVRQGLHLLQTYMTITDEDMLIYTAFSHLPKGEP